LLMRMPMRKTTNSPSKVAARRSRRIMFVGP
jgi:hypothetical protein